MGKIEPSPNFAEVGMAADLAAKEDAVTNPDDSERDHSGLPSKSWQETYSNEVQQNMEAHRKMRFWAFIGLSVIVVVFLAALLAALIRIFCGDFLVATLGASPKGWEWHVLVFVGVCLALLAAIALSLSLAVMRMISDKDADDGSGLKTPNTELGKVLFDLIKGFVSQGKSG